jgi:hypothetical protein
MLKSPESVQAEYADHICSPKFDGSIIDELTMVWAEFESILQLVWKSSSFKNNVRAGFGLKEEKWEIVGKMDKLTRDVGPAAAAAVVPARAPIEGAGHFKDIVCDQCHKSPRLFLPPDKLRSLRWLRSLCQTAVLNAKDKSATHSEILESVHMVRTANSCTLRKSLLILQL